MSIKIMSLIWEEAVEMRGTDLIVLLALGDWANDMGLSWHGVKALAKKARVTDRAVQYSLSYLKSLHYITVEYGDPAKHETSRYVVQTDPKLWLPAPPGARMTPGEEEFTPPLPPGARGSTTLVHEEAPAPSERSFTQYVREEPSIEPPIPLSNTHDAPTHESTSMTSLTTGGKMILFMGKKPETGGKSHAPKSGRGTEELLSWALARGFEGEAAVLDDWIEDCLLHWGKKKERMGDWEMACLKWIKDNIRRGGAYPTGGQANGRVQAPGPTGTGGRRYGYNDAGEPTNRATAYEENKRELERRQLARRMAEQAGGDVITLGPDEWRKLDPE